jgi:hypothetical protein
MPGPTVWWDEQLSGDEPVGLCWTVLTAFVRIGTNTQQQKPLHFRSSDPKMHG